VNYRQRCINVNRERDIFLQQKKKIFCYGNYLIAIALAAAISAAFDASGSLLKASTSA